MCSVATSRLSPPIRSVIIYLEYIVWGICQLRDLFREKSAIKDTTFLNPGSHFFTLHTDSDLVNS